MRRRRSMTCMKAACRDVNDPKNSVPWAQLISIAVRNINAVFVFCIERMEARGTSMNVRGTPE